MTPAHIKEIMVRRDWTEAEMAAAVFKDPKTIQNWLKGGRIPPAVHPRLRHLLNNARKRDHIANKNWEVE